MSPENNKSDDAVRRRIKFAVARAVYGWLNAMDLLEGENQVDPIEVEILIASLVDVVECELSKVW